MTELDLAFYEQQGYWIARSLLGGDELQVIRDLFTGLAEAGLPAPGWTPEQTDAGRRDPLLRYPRMMFPDRHYPMIRRLLLDQRLAPLLTALLGEQPVAAQSMYYFKPPGARGQALHQDNFYLKAQPGTCMAAWIAIDPATQANGGLMVVPGTHRLAVQCPERADTELSFTVDTVPPPDGMQAVAVDLAPGDCLFFNGSLIHGSAPNRSRDQWRQALIFHYVGVSAKVCSEWFFPLLDFAGNEFSCAADQGVGPCGTTEREAVVEHFVR